MWTKSKAMLLVAALVFLACGPFASRAGAAPTQAPIIGEIEHITINDINDPWSGGVIVVGGQSVILPRNLLIDLPANRLTLKQLFNQAPTACRNSGLNGAQETGLAKGDSCNASGTGGFATIAANRTNGGNIIAGDVLIQKGNESVAGRVTFIDHTDGYLRINGVLGNANTGIMIRLNDPTGRHSVQQGLGCLPGAVNCSPDPRFGLDPDNYVVAFSTGFPACIPSTVPRTFVDVLGLGVTTAQGASDGTGDVLCPDTNRSINSGNPVDDSRRFAPIRLGDDIAATGNLETINCATFVSAHSLKVSKALATKNLATQPDYMFIEQAFMKAPAFQDQKIESHFFGSTTRAPADVVVWSVHNDPVGNQPHEFLLATTLGCDAAAGVGSCTAKAILPAAGVDIFSVTHVVDFRFLPTARLLDPCAHLRADARFIPLNVCPAGGTFAEQFSVLSPVPRQIHAKTGQKLVNPGLISLDVQGNLSPNGQYYFQIGIGLASMLVPDFAGIDLNLINTPFSFSGIPWNLDRRLSPGGCLPAGCDQTPQPLDPFPFESLDPRTQAATPTGPYIDPNFNRGILTTTNNRVLSYVSGAPVGGVFNFDGNDTILAWPPVDPPALPTPPIPPLLIHPPVVTITSIPVVTATQRQLYSYQVVAANPSACGPLTYSFDTAPVGMTVGVTGLIQWTPTSTQVGSNSVTVRATDANGSFDIQSFGVVVTALRPVAVNDFDGDGKSDLVVWRPTEGNWYILGSQTGAVTVRQWGAPTDVPVRGDFDGDGKADIAVWRPGDGNWYIIRSSDAAVVVTQWGTAGTLNDIPVPGDYDGDGKTDIAVWRPGEGNWYIQNSQTGTVTVRQWGVSTDIPVPGDYDGDGKTDVAVWRPGEGNWYIVGSQAGVSIQQLGAATDVPVPGDYDGNGKANVAAWRPADGTWYLFGLGLPGSTTQRQWGTAGDVPMP
jgi:hypothetical protein